MAKKCRQKMLIKINILVSFLVNIFVLIWLSDECGIVDYGSSNGQEM
jgi:hypothetical protein